MTALPLPVLMVHPAPGPDAVPLAAACIASALRKAFPDAIDAYVVEAFAGEAPEAVTERILAKGRPPAIGFSIYSWGRELALASARLLAAGGGRPFLIAGGPEAVALASMAPVASPFDAIVIGEGEEAVVDLVRAALDGRETIGRRAASGPRVVRGPLPDAETLPSPWLDGSLKPAAGGSVLWELGRGCPYACAYCQEARSSRPRSRVPMARIREELASFVKAGTARAFVLDPTFNADRERCLDLLALLASAAPGIRFDFEIRAELVDRAQAKGLAALASSVQIGLQSANPAALEAVGRSLDRKAFDRGVAILEAAGVTYGFDLMYGLPRDGLATFRESIDFALKRRPNNLAVFPLSILPGTELARPETLERHGLSAMTEPPYLLRESRSFPAVDLGEAAHIARACDIFYTRGRAVGWFLPVIGPLGTGPSAFLEGFASLLRALYPSAQAKEGWAPPDPLARLSSEAIEALQLRFIRASYGKKALASLVPAAESLVRLHGAWARALAEGQGKELELSYDPEDLFSPLCLDLGNFIRAARPARARYRVMPGPDGPRIERLGKRVR